MTLFVAPHLQQLDKILMPRVNQIFQFLPDDLVPQRRQDTWTFNNGSVVRLDGVSVGRGVRIRGDAVHLAIIDECRDITDLEQLVGSHIAPMFTTTNGRLIMISTPPESPAHSFTDKFIREAIERNDFYSATYRQNPLLSTERLRYLTKVLYPGGEDNLTFRREYMADYSVADEDKRVIREWNETANDEFFKTYPGPDGLVRRYIGLDFASADPCGIIGGWFDPMQGCLVIAWEHFERHLNTSDVGRIILDIEKKLEAVEGPPPIRIMDCDPSLMSDLYGMFGLKFEPAYKINSGIAMLNRLRVAVLEGKVRVHPRCTNLKFQLRTGVFNSKQTDYLRTERTGHLDLIDALKYVVLNLRWNELIRPDQPRGGTDVPQGHMRVGAFRPPGNFKGGVIQRPI
jgi:hypothetical protein